jgi:hypothetical protein
MSGVVMAKNSRMPRKGAHKPAESPSRAVVPHGSLEAATPELVLRRYLTDESTKDIAADYGVTRQALSAFLLKHAEEDWKQAQVVRAIARKEKAEDDLEAAQDPLALAKARELLKAAQWDLERVCKRIYAQDHGVNVNINVTDLGDRLRRAKARVFDQ